MKREVLSAVRIENMGATGKALARHNDMVVFVEGAIPGDIVDVDVRKKKKSFWEGRVKQLVQGSEDRKEASCQHFTLCGGCKWQNVRYEAQLQYKQQQVVDNLVRLAKVDPGQINDIVPSAQELQYRNKLEYTFSNWRWFTKEEVDSGKELNKCGVGFHLPGQFDKIIDIEECLLQGGPSNKIRNLIREYALSNALGFYDIKKHEGFLRNLIVRTANTGEVMVILQVGRNEEENIRKTLDYVLEKVPEVTCAYYVVNGKKNDTFFDLEVVHYGGKPYIAEKMVNPSGEGHLHYRVGPKSFYQTNSLQAEVLYKIAWEYAGLQGDEIVYDLFTGTGTIANYVAGNAQKVVGIEYVPEAIEDARINSSINSINNTVFFAGDMKDILTTEFMEQEGHPNVIITDPPRAGMHADVCERLLHSGAEKIVYVSCNPATQARDIGLLDSRYFVEKVQPVDMFPHTPHVENVILLRLRE
ncbi:MAG: 23S rRNA (uracil(1939)-C(5))-methyltransferase RlmD [Cyclobacteriaceae bacterium]|nr:23S rRNA (uracil(1939)-C(5))-methyltransferase RlmD [Cyclobacteriaceae bacterium]